MAIGNSGSSDDWARFGDSDYVCNKTGEVRSTRSQRAVKAEGMPRSGDAHLYVRLTLVPRSGKQHRVALRNVMAVAWGLQGSDGSTLQLDPQGHLAGTARVYHRDRNPHNNQLSNLVVLEEVDAFRQGLALHPSMLALTGIGHSHASQSYCRSYCKYWLRRALSCKSRPCSAHRGGVCTHTHTHTHTSGCKSVAHDEQMEGGLLLQHRHVC